METEKSFENQIKKFLDSKNCWYVKYFANSYTKSGIPDILACVNGLFVAIEVKAEHGKATELQYWNRNKIRESGGIAIILYPNQFEQFKMMIEDMINHSDWFASSEQVYFDKT